ncbi:MAG: hypothetical protein IKX68_08175 [Clostridiales bacterium]|nr:hypothetical protein [Clostridiales bacterium]
MIETIETEIWGRSFILPVVYDCYAGEKVTQTQMDMMNVFAHHLDWIDDSKFQVEDYCREDVLSDDENDKKDNVFSYLKPDCIFVKRSRKEPRVALMLKYRYDPEHGLAVVFTMNGEISIGSQDIIL